MRQFHAGRLFHTPSIQDATFIITDALKYKHRFNVVAGQGEAYCHFFIYC